MPLLAAGGAQAADGATWDRVAQCESGGLWSANSGNGYYGGLQLTLETWQEYGGTELAARPDLASRSQQIEIAEKVLADQGSEAWPSCSISAGLLPDAPDAPDVEVPDTPDVEVPEAPDVPDAELPETELPEAPDVPETEVPDAPDPEPSDGASQDGSAGGGTPDADPSDDPTDGSSEDSTGEAPGDGTADGSNPDDSPSPPAETSGTGSGIGEPSPDVTPQPPATGGDGGGRHRGSPDDRPRGDGDRPSRGKHGKPGESTAEDAYRVRPGDSLSAIAAEHDVRGGWTALYAANEETVGEDPDLILPGQLLDLRTGGELR